MHKEIYSRGIGWGGPSSLCIAVGLIRSLAPSLTTATAPVQG